MTQQQSPSSASGDMRSKTEAARSQAPQVARNAAQAGGQVAQGAMNQGRQTAEETGRQARNLLGHASSQFSHQADAQQKRAAQRLRSLGDELQSMSSQDEQHGMAGDLARQAADRAHRVADWLEQREPGAVVEEVRMFARNHPGMFLAGAAVAGMLAGRLTRGAASSGGMGGGGMGGGGMPGGGMSGGGMPGGELAADAPAGTSGDGRTGDGRPGGSPQMPGVDR